LLEKLEAMKASLAGRVFDVIGEVLSLNDVNLSEAEQSALGKLLANWRAVVEFAVVSKAERADKKRAQEQLFE
jgi:hypothetical protein